MARAAQRQRPGLPNPRSVVAEMPFTPPGQAVAPGSAAPYRIIRTTEVDPYDAPVPAPQVAAIGAAPAAPAGDTFKGTSRKAAKLSIVAGTPDAFDDLKKLIDDLPPDKTMTKHVPPITTKSTSDRVIEEKRNVLVQAFLYAASREDDNDFHLILGRDPKKAPMYLTVELSGLPPKSSKHFKRLKKTRDDYKAFFSANVPGMTYDFYDPPIPVEVQGSLFFDMSHAKGSKPGPKSLSNKIPTIWEIHPISKIVFEP